MLDMGQQETESQRGRNQQGASLVEYALLVALIAVVCVVAIQGLGTTVSTQYSEISSGLDTF